MALSPLDINDAFGLICGTQSVREDLEKLLTATRASLPMKHRSTLESKIRHLRSLEEVARTLHTKLEKEDRA